MSDLRLLSYIEGRSLLQNHADLDILQHNMNTGFALHHHAHLTSLEDRAIPLCIPIPVSQ